MRVTGIAQREAWLARAMPGVEEVRPGLWSVPVPIPFSPLRYTLSYLVASGPGVIVVDPGWDSDDGWQALTGGLGAAGATTADVTGIVVTHVHPDHHGLSARLRAACGEWIAMHPAERDSLPVRVWDTAKSPARDLRWLLACGAPAGIAAELSGNGPVMEMLLAMPEPDVLLEDGDLVPYGRPGTPRAISACTRRPRTSC
jgi:glyoxylase-like metal-dependent hydrolase (beta-lactamase superfamily II)